VLALNVSGCCYSFLAELAKQLLKVTIWFVMSVHMEHLFSHWMDFIFMVFAKKKSVKQILLLLKSDEVTQMCKFMTV